MMKTCQKIVGAKKLRLEKLMAEKVITRTTGLTEKSTVPFSWIVWIIIGAASVVIPLVTVSVYISQIQSKADSAIKSLDDNSRALSDLDKKMDKKLDDMSLYFKMMDERLSRIEGQLSISKAHRGL